MKRSNIWKIFHFVRLLLIFTAITTNMPTDNSFAENIKNDIDNKKYFFEMDKKKQDEFFKKLGLIKFGDSVQTVKSIFGEPTNDVTGKGKKRGEFLARVLTYYFKILKENDANMNNRFVSLIFNDEDKLIEITSNVEDFPEKIKSELKEKIKIDFEWQSIITYSIKP